MVARLYSNIIVNPLVIKGDTRNILISVHQMLIEVLSEVFTVLIA